MPAKVKEIIEELNKLAPEGLAENWDNVGLQVGTKIQDVSKILLALDATANVIDEAINMSADMIITHHPMIFKPLNKVTKEDPIAKRVYQLIENNISLYVMHTNFDTAFGGTNDVLAEKLGLSNIEVINPNEGGMGIGRIGHTHESTMRELVEVLKQKLELSHVRVVGDIERVVKRVAICTGSGMSFINHAINKADVFITGDVKFHEAQEANDLGIGVIDVGHYGSENIAMPAIKEYLSHFSRKKDIEIIISQINEDPFTTI